MVVLLLVTLVAFWWLWRSETGETAREIGRETDLQRIRLDMGVLAAVDVLRQMEFLSGAGLESDDFQRSFRSAVASVSGIVSLRLFDRNGRRILLARRSADGILLARRSGNGNGAAQDSGSSLPEAFFEDLKGLPDGQVLISEFSLSDGQGRRKPVILVGAGLFFPSGARAGFLVAEMDAEDLVDSMVGGGSGTRKDLFIVSSDGKWIYDPREGNPWQGIDEEGPKRWIVDDFPEVWRAMISSGDGSYADEDIWIFRDHVPMETVKEERRTALRAEDDIDREVNAKPFYVLRRVDDTETWDEIWSAVIPLLILLCVSLTVSIPSILRRREALQSSERAAAELREATLRTRMAMEAARISEWKIDLRSGAVTVDKRMASMLLLGAEDRITTVKQWQERIHPSDRRKVSDTLEPLWEQGMGTFSIRHRMRRGDKSWGWYRFRGAVRQDGGDDAGKVILGAYIDLTDVVLREAELNRLEMATRQSLSGIAILDKEGIVEWANEAFRNQSERRGSSPIGRAIWEMLPVSGPASDQEKELIRDAVYRGDEFSRTFSFHPSEGESSWRQLTGNPVLDEGGVPANYVVIETDVSREKRTEADLSKSESLLAESQHLAGIGSWEIDCEEGTMFWSDQTYRIFGVDKNFVPDTDRTLAFFPNPDHDELRWYLDEAVRSGKQFEGEFGAVLGDGSKKWIFVKGMALREGGVTSKVFGVVQDVSRRKDYEEALVRSKEEAEMLNEKLTAALDKAHASERKAKEANDAKGSFLSMISHEIRNPLNGVIGMTSLLRDTEMADEQRDYVETIHNSGSSLLMLLDDILDFSKIEQGKIEFEHKEFPLRQVIEESVLLFGTRIDQKGLDHAFYIDPAAPERVVGDVTRVKQILFNLLGNAVKFTEKGSIIVEVELRERLPNDRCLLVFRVGDTGIGIPSDRHERIFQSFSQVDPSISRKFGGSGLGLAISRELSRRMGGDISFESEAGQGTVFEVMLPFPAIFTSGGSGKLQQSARGHRALCLFSLDTRGKHFESCLQARGVPVELFDDLSGWLGAVAEAPREAWIFADAEFLTNEEVVRVLRGRPKSEGFRPPVLVAAKGSKWEPDFEAVFLSRPVFVDRLDTLLEGDAPKETGEAGASKGAKAPPEEEKDVKILIAEDNAVNQKVIRLLLKRMGYGCDVVENGRLAVEKARTGGFDVILMDIQMPEMDGIEATEAIVAEMPREKRPWIVALTAGATRDNREEAMKAGMDGYLTKPVQPDDLRAELERAAERVGNGR